MFPNVVQMQFAWVYPTASQSSPFWLQAQCPPLAFKNLCFVQIQLFVRVPSMVSADGTFWETSCSTWQMCSTDGCSEPWRVSSVADGSALFQVCIFFFSMGLEGTLYVPIVTNTLGNIVWKELFSGGGNRVISKSWNWIFTLDAALLGRSCSRQTPASYNSGLRLSWAVAYVLWSGGCWNNCPWAPTCAHSPVNLSPWQSSGFCSWQLFGSSQTKSLRNSHVARRPPHPSTFCCWSVWALRTHL